MDTRDPRTASAKVLSQKCFGPSTVRYFQFYTRPTGFGPWTPYKLLPFGREATHALATSLLRKSSFPYCLLINEALMAVATASTSLSFSKSTKITVKGGQ